MKTLHTIIFILFVVTANLFAGGPLYTMNGKAVRFKSDTVKYHLDRGPFGIFTNKQARDLANASFKTWEDVATSAVAFNHQPGDTLPVDVNGTNWQQYTSLTGVKVDGINPIVFDSDGAITDALFGSGASADVIGFAFSEDVNNDGFLDEGEAFMNGKLADGTANSFTYEEWKSTFVHEFGHFLGLDHTQINGEFVTVATKTIYIPTMYPTSTVNDVPLGDLNPDDIAAISELYPGPTFASTTGKIFGSVKRANNSVVRGANVIAISAGADSLMNQISTVTDYYEKNTGDYTVVGLAPGSYYIRIEPIDPEFTGGSSVGPYAGDASGLSFVNPVKKEYYNGENESGDPAIDDPNAKTSVAVTAGNTTTGINLIANGVGAGGVLLTEDFSFSGNLSANGWSVHSGTTNPIATTTGLTYNGYSGSGIGNAALVNNLGGEDVNKGFDAVGGNGTTLYYSALVNVTDAATAKTGDYFLNIGNRANATNFTSFSARVFARITSSNVNFGISNTSAATYGTTNFTKNKVYLLVVKYTINTGGNDEAKLWVLPSGVPTSEANAGTAELTNTSTAGQDSINAIALRQGSNSTQPAIVVDGIRVALAWPLASTVGVEKNSTAPNSFALQQNYPNPFNPSTKINFSLPVAGFTTLKVYDVLGKEITTLVNGHCEAGNYSAQFNASTLPSGIYFYQLTSGSYTAVKKMMLVK